MSIEFFVAISLIGTWALLPLSLVMALTTFDNELQSEPHH